jgi:cobalt-zinc-cadmium efflux system outer membrane protein
MLSLVSVVFARAEEPGGNLDDLIAMMASAHPSLAAAAAAQEAASDEIEIAGALQDPQFEVSFEDIDREDDGPLPQRLGSIFYSIEQTFPLGGKRALRRAVAKADAAQVATARNQTLLDLTAQMKTAFAQHYLAVLMTGAAKAEGETLRGLAEIARERYAQGLGRQQDAIEAEAEQASLAGTLAEVERDRSIAVGRINALIGRPLDAPLATPAALPAVPDMARLNLSTLLALAEHGNPAIAKEQAVVEGANAARDLAERNWYPDLTLGFSVVDEDRDVAGYEAKIGFNIPLQWGLRRAEQGQAKAKLAEARAKASVAHIELSSRISETLQNLRAVTVREATMRKEQLPRLAAAIDAARRAYAVSQAELDDVLSAVRRQKQAEREHLGMLFEQQTLLAELERLVGGAL